MVRSLFFLLYTFYSLSSQSPDRCATAQLAGVEESEDEDKDSKEDDLARMLLDGDDDNSEDDEIGSDQEDLLGDEHMDDDDDDSGDNEKDAVSGEEESDDVSEGEDDVSEGEDDVSEGENDVSEGEDDDVIDKDGKETEGATWEDIYGRTRASDGRILAGGENTAAAARYVPPAMRNKAALQGPDEKKRKELERLKKQVGVSVFRIRIRSGFQSGHWIRIRIQEGKNDSQK